MPASDALPPDSVLGGRGAVIVMLVLSFGVAIGIWAVRRESAADRCTRVVIERLAAQASAAHAPPKPSDVAWSAEHCYGGKPR